MENDESPSNVLVSLPIPGINLGGPPDIAEAIWVTALPDPPIDASVTVSAQPFIEESDNAERKRISDHVKLDCMHMMDRILAGERARGALYSAGTTDLAERLRAEVDSTIAEISTQMFNAETMREWPAHVDRSLARLREDIAQDAVETLTRDGAPYSAGTAALGLLDRIGALIYKVAETWGVAPECFKYRTVQWGYANGKYTISIVLDAGIEAVDVR